MHQTLAAIKLDKSSRAADESACRPGHPSAGKQAHLRPGVHPECGHPSGRRACARPAPCRP